MSFDFAISRFCAGLLGRAPMLDEAILTLSGSNLMKGAALMAMLAYCWMYLPAGPEGKARMMHHRAILCAALIASCAGEIFALGLAKVAPFRLRPLLEPALAMPVPDQLRALAPTLMDQSSYPSDHALLFIAMATGLWLVHRRVGLLAFVWVIVLILLPRLYLGLHYASDLIVGGVIGAAFALIGGQMIARRAAMGAAINLSVTRPAAFYPALFLATFQIATMLEDVRSVLTLLRG